MKCKSFWNIAIRNHLANIDYFTFHEFSMDLHDYFFKWEVRVSSIPLNATRCQQIRYFFHNIFLYWKTHIFQKLLPPYAKIFRDRCVWKWFPIFGHPKPIWGNRGPQYLSFKKTIMQIHWQFVKCKLLDVWSIWTCFQRYQGWIPKSTWRLTSRCFPP